MRCATPTRETRLASLIAHVSTGTEAQKEQAAEELAAKDAADRKAKREKEAAAEKERDEIDRKNAERVAKLEAEGKKTKGGLHQFDESEVDAYGGEGTADDFMDAFGF